MNVPSTALVALATLVLAAGPAGAQLWRWTDGEGVVRYTNDPAAIPPVYRDAARDIGSPQPRSAPVTGGATVIPFAARGPITAGVHLNGVPLLLLVDTGAERTVISPAAIARAGMDPERGRLLRIVGVTGSATAREVVVPLLDVAGARVGPLPVIVHEMSVGEVDGLLGRDVLDYFTLTVDSAGGRAILAPR